MGGRRQREAYRRPFGGLGRRLLALLGLAAIVGVVIAILFAAGLIGRPGDVPAAAVLEPPRPAGVQDFEVGTSVGKFAPDFEATRLDTRQRVRLSDFRGQPVYLNFWASSCLYCIAEMPDIAQLMKNHPELVVIGINRGQGYGRAQSYLDSIKLHDGTKGMRFSVAAMDPTDVLYDEFRGLGMPVSIFIDAKGRIVRVWNSLLRLAQMEEFYAETVASAPLSDRGTAERPAAPPGP
ncbi:MAG: TlpA family protein disulfide reductase [Chloroflexi bacterium]|nr:TlpA family protein disulfide reductase [Chloroflexota bacterium]